MRVKQLQRLPLIEEIRPGIAFLLEQGGNIFDCEVGNFHALLNLFPGQRHRDSALVWPAL